MKLSRKSLLELQEKTMKNPLIIDKHNIHRNTNPNINPGYIPNIYIPSDCWHEKLIIRKGVWYIKNRDCRLSEGMQKDRFNAWLKHNHPKVFKIYINL